MIRIKPLLPKPVKTPQCDAPFDQSPYSDYYIRHRTERCDQNGWDIKKCGRYSSYKIGEKHLCSQHAGIEAIKILMEKEND